MFSRSPVKASNDLTRFTLTSGAGIAGNGTSCMSLCRSIWACTTSCCACSKFASPASTAQRNLARMVHPLAHGLSLSHLCLQKVDAFFGVPLLPCLRQLQSSLHKHMGRSLRGTSRTRAAVPGVIKPPLWRGQGAIRPFSSTRESFCNSFSLPQLPQALLLRKLRV